MNAGATPNDTTSASESNSTPNWVVVLVSRATLPSSMSITIATKMATAASVYRPSAARMIARKPQNRFPVVKRLGSRKIPRRGWSRSSCQRRRRGPRPPSPPVCLRLMRLLFSVEPGAASVEQRHDRLAAADPRADVDLDGDAAGRDQVRPRAEADEAETRARLQLVAAAHAAHDAPREHAGDLADGHPGGVALERH